MSIFTYHLANISAFEHLKILINPIKNKNVKGLIHIEYMTVMTLGSAVFSTERFLLGKIAIFAQWESENDVDNFLNNYKLGKLLVKGWHTRLKFLRQWGYINDFTIPNENTEIYDENKPVVAVTLARMKLFQVPRFIKWGRPVEELVRDNPEKTLALASIRLLRTVSTFSIWKSQKEMSKMVFGHSSVDKPKRHIDAMRERDRKDFHFQFTTLRFKPIAEFGEWEGRKNIIPNFKTEI